MVSNISSLFAQLECFARQELTLEALHDQLSSGLQEYFDNTSGEDIEILSEILSAIYEVEDGILDEEEFHLAIKELITRQQYSPTITVGELPAHSAYCPHHAETLSGPGNLHSTLNVA